MHVIGTAGHVDHGKSTLVERLTGIDPDRFEEEKRRGLTIDLGFAWLRLPSGREIGIVDVPGHERFIKNMLAGAGGINVCLFVVAANEGWMPQSAEHLSILEILGVRSGVVAVTKADTVDDAELRRVVGEIGGHLSGSCLEGAPVVPCSAPTGLGLDELVARLDDVIASTSPARDEGRPRLWIDRVFSISGAGTVVTGTLAGGSLRAGGEVNLLGPDAPRPRAARIRSLQSHKKSVAEIGPGNRVALNLAGLERTSARRGDAVVTGSAWRLTTRIDALVRVLPEHISGRGHTLTETGAHLLYTGTAETPVRLKLLDAAELNAGERGHAQIYLRDPLPLQRGDRFVLRDAGRILTFGGGEVLDSLASVARRRDEGHLELLARLAGAEADEAVRAFVEGAGAIDAAETLARAAAASAPEGITRLGHLLVSEDRMKWLGEKTVRLIDEYHGARPLELGIPREALRTQLGLEPDAFGALLAAVDGIVEEGATVRLARHAVSLSPEQEAARAALLTALLEGGFAPPLTKDLHAAPELLRSLERAGEIVRIGDFHLAREQAAEVRRRVRERIEASGPATVAEIRDLLGTTRKYAVPLCEWLDQTGATLRRGDVRLLGPRP